MQRMLGIDYGEKRVGLALSDETGRFALPLVVLSNDKNLLRETTRLAKEHSVQILVVGESKNFKQEDNPIMAAVNRFAKNLKQSGFEVVFEPELFTSAAAERLQGKNSETDASAAALILQSYLDRISPSDTM